jgi:hypothetical protein
MPHIHTSRRRAASAVLIMILTALVLSACGSSSTKTTSAASATATNGSTIPGSPAKRFAALRECLLKNGIKLPQRAQGQRPPGVGLLSGGPPAFQLPAGVTRAQYEAALKKCGGGAIVRGGTRGFGRLRNPQFQAALKKFATCMRANGVNVPEPNTSGSGPIFGTKGLDTGSPQFKSATAKCASQLRSSFPRGPRAGGAPGGGTGTAPAGPGEPSAG